MQAYIQKPAQGAANASDGQCLTADIKDYAKGDCGGKGIKTLE